MPSKKKESGKKTAKAPVKMAVKPSPKAKVAAAKPAPKAAPKAAPVKAAPVKAAVKPPAPASPYVRVNKEKEAALREAAKIAETLATKVKDPLTSVDKKPLKPVDPKEAARAIKQIKTSFFASMATSSAPTAVTTSVNSPFPPRIQALLDKQEITELMYAYARGIDRAEENLIRSVFHPDASVDFGPGIFQGGLPEFVTWALDVRGNMRATHHMVANIRVDLRGDSANAETYFTTWHRLDKSTGKEDFFVGGRYLDRLERRPTGSSGVWKIAHRKQVKDWTRTTPVAELFYHLNPDALWAHHSRQDLSYQIENFPTGKKAKAPTFLARRYDAKSMKV
jgi:hypothetical protein